jgi:hypothetical protein
MPETPDWVTDTPPDHSYSIDMYENSDATIQNIEITRTEFLALKEHLARMRGYEVQKPVAEHANHAQRRLQTL